MIYSTEVKAMCPVHQGVHHGAAPIPEEAKWVKSKEVKDTPRWMPFFLTREANSLKDALSSLTWEAWTSR